MDKALEELLDKQAIEEVLIRYCRTQDWLDDDGQASCFWDDADVDYGFWRGSGAEFVPMVMEVERGSARRWHMSTNSIVKVDGESASAESYGIAVGTSEGGESTMYGGRYLDEFEKRNGEWRISKRTYILDWANAFPNALEVATGDGFTLHILDIVEGGHPMYRPM